MKFNIDFSLQPNSEVSSIYGSLEEVLGKIPDTHFHFTKLIREVLEKSSRLVKKGRQMFGRFRLRLGEFFIDLFWIYKIESDEICLLQTETCPHGGPQNWEGVNVNHWASSVSGSSTIILYSLKEKDQTINKIIHSFFVPAFPYEPLLNYVKECKFYNVSFSREQFSCRRLSSYGNLIVFDNFLVTPIGFVPLSGSFNWVPFNWHVRPKELLLHVSKDMLYVQENYMRFKDQTVKGKRFLTNVEKNKLTIEIDSISRKKGLKCHNNGHLIWNEKAYSLLVQASMS
jgi:hypothetical protein